MPNVLVAGNVQNPTPSLSPGVIAFRKMMPGEEEQVIQIKDLCPRRLLHIAQCLENQMTMDVLSQTEKVLNDLLQLSSFVSVENSMFLVEEALQCLVDNPQKNTEDSVFRVENNTRGEKYEIPRETLESLTHSNLKVKQIAELLNVSKRTVERRMNEYKLTIRQSYSQISDEELVVEVSKLCHEHPNVGYRTIKSLLQTKGLWIQENRVRKCVKDCDPCGVLFRRVFLSSSSVHRRTYSVSGPQALWHIDGNHKLISSR